LEKFFTGSEKNPGEQGKVGVNVIENQMHPVISVAVGYGVLRLVVDFKHVTRCTGDALEGIQGYAALKDDPIRVLHQNRYVDAMCVSDPFSRIVVDGNGHPRWQGRQQHADDPLRWNAQNVQNRLYGQPHVIAPVPPRQFVNIAQKVVAKDENDFVDTPGIVRGTADGDVVDGGVGFAP
jgi:hypothetical protein